MTSGEPGTPSRCGECGAPLAGDQTYCIVCGARVRPLPARVAVALFDIEARGHAIAPDDSPLSDPDEDEPEDDEEQPDQIVSAARGGVIALLAMIAVGVVIGGLTSTGGLRGLANTIVLAFKPGVQQAAQVVAPSPGGGGGGGGGSRARSGSGGGSGGGGGGRGGGARVTATTPAPVTVTVSQSQSTTPGGGGGGGGGASSSPHLPPIGHVWLIMLSQQGYAQSWEDRQSNPYLSALVRQGELVVGYDAVATSPLANEIALLSGQGPTNATIASCPAYAAMSPGRIGKAQQVLGDGCIYPDSTQSLPQQIADDGLQWKAYIQGIGEDTAPCAPGSTASSSTTATVPASMSTSTSPTTTSSDTTSCPQTSTTASPSSGPSTTTQTAAPSTTSPSSTGSTTTGASSTGPGAANAPVDTVGEATCPHPALGAPSLNQGVSPAGTYVNWKNPIIYFQSLLDPGGNCNADDVGLPQLAKDLKDPGATPAFSYIAPDPCNDGSDTPCRPGAQAGLGQAQAFLRQIVPEIERSADYRQDGLILITFDEAQQSGPNWDTSSCCGQPVYPNLPSVTATQSSTSTSGCATTTSGSSSTASTTSAPTTTPTTTETTTQSTSTTTSTCTPAIAGNPPGAVRSGC